MAPSQLPDLAEFSDFFEVEFERYSEEIESTDRIPADLIRASAELGAFKLTVPHEFGGFGMTMAAYLPYLMTASKGPGAGRMLVHVNNGIWRPLANFGNQSQRSLVRKIGTGEVCVAFAFTERAGGTGRDLRSRATRDGAGWRVTGEKHLITFGDRADHFVLVVATDDRREKDSLTAFLVPRETEGFSIRANQRTMGLHGTGHAFLDYENMYVDDSRRLGQLGQGLEVALTFLDYSRVSLSTCMVGLGQRALEEAVSFSRKRTTFGKAISERQAVQIHLAEMQSDLAAGHALVSTLAGVIDAGQDITAPASAAKLFCLNMIGRVTDHALRVHGGFGYTKDSVMERIYRDARGFWFEEGTAEIQQVVIARALLSGD